MFVQQSVLCCDASFFVQHAGMCVGVYISRDYSCVFVLKACHNYSVVRVFVCGVDTRGFSSRIFTASSFIAAQNHTKMKNI